VIQLQDTWGDGAYADANMRPHGLLDVKGSGVAPGRIPTPEMYRSGLIALPIALGELVTQRVVERIFESVGADVHGVGIYAILDLGFRMKSVSGALLPAAAVIRRAHQRAPGNDDRPAYASDEHRVKLILEFILRYFGVTSCGTTGLQIWREVDGLHTAYAHRTDHISSASLERFLGKMSLSAPVDIEMLNVQITRRASLSPLSAVLVDFGQYHLGVGRFVKPIGSFVRTRPMHWGGFIDANSSCYIQPSPEFSLDTALAYGRPTPSWIPEWTGAPSPALTTGLFVFAAELVRDFTHGKLTRGGIERRIRDVVETTTRKISGPGETGSGLNDSATDSGSRYARLRTAAMANVEGYFAQNALRWKRRPTQPADGQRVALSTMRAKDAEAAGKVAANASWESLAPAFLARVGVDSAFLDLYANPPAPKLPEGAEQYLSVSNPRLRELQDAYRRVESAVVQHSVWTASYVSADVPLQRFRGDTAYVWQQRDLNLPSTYVLTYYYLWASGQKALLDRLPEDEMFGVYTIPVNGEAVSRDRLDSATEIAFLERTLGISQRESFRILDIGSGYGRLAHRLVQAFPNVSVICVDAVAESTFLCEYYVKARGVDSRVQVVPLPEIESVLANTSIDAAVNIHSFSECTAGAIRWWLDLLTRAQVPHLMIAPCAGASGGMKLLSTEADGTRQDFEPLLAERGYRHIIAQAKYGDPIVQQFGITPTYHHVFSLSPTA